METIDFDLETTRTQPIHIFFLGDVHEGNANQAEKELHEAVNIIKNTKNSYWIGMGDMIDGIWYKDPRFDPAEVHQKYKLSDLKDLSKRQMKNVYKSIKSIENKCICLLRGNHEEAFIKHNGYDPTETLQSLMKSHPKIMGYTGVVHLRIKRGGSSVNYTIHVNHGVGGGGKREGTPINTVHDLSRYIIADVHVIGHIHRMGIDRQIYTSVQYSSGNKCRMVKRPVLFGANGCFLHKWKLGTRGYFEPNAGPEASIGMLMLSIKLGDSKQSSKLKLEPIYLE